MMMMSYYVDKYTFFVCYPSRISRCIRRLFQIRCFIFGWMHCKSGIRHMPATINVAPRTILEDRLNISQIPNQQRTQCFFSLWILLVIHHKSIIDDNRNKMIGIACAVFVFAVAIIGWSDVVRPMNALYDTKMNVIFEINKSFCYIWAIVVLRFRYSPRVFNTRFLSLDKISDLIQTDTPKSERKETIKTSSSSHEH